MNINPYRMEAFREEWIIKEYTNKEKDINVRVLKHHEDDDYAIQTSKTMDITWGYTKEGANRTFKNIVASYEGENE